MADVPECFGEYNKISNSERAENDCRTCPFLDACAKVPNPLADAFRAGWNACEADVKRLRAENERLNRQWQPIETAPVDGTEILVYEECGGTNVMLFIEGQFREKVSFCSLRSPPTHWMPLPSPPPA